MASISARLRYRFRSLVRRWFRCLFRGRGKRRLRYLFRSRFKCCEHGTIYDRGCADCRRARWRRRARERCSVHGLGWSTSCRRCRRALNRRRARLDRKITRGIAWQLVIESLKGVGYGLAVTVLIAWMFQNSGDAVPLPAEIIVAAITAAILFDPVVTGTRLVKRWFRITSHQVDDTDALWEADWQTSRERRRRKEASTRRRRWLGATVGSMLLGGLNPTLMLFLFSQNPDISIERIRESAINEPVTSALLFAGLIAGVIILTVIGGRLGHQFEKALRPRPEENPMRRDDW